MADEIVSRAVVEVTTKLKDVSSDVRKETTKAGNEVGKQLSTKGGKAADQAGKETGRRYSTALKNTVSKAGAALGVAAAGGLLAFGAALVQGGKDAARYEVLQRKTEAVIASTGNVANISTKGIQELAGSLESLSGVDEELIINGQNVLATFTQVRNEAGKGNDVFNQATEAALNMSVALGTDMKQSALLVGKALNDPIKGVTALRRSGVQLTDQQTEQVKAFVASGETLKAQKIILGELETQFGGVAAASGNTLTGRIARAQDAFADMFRELGGNLLPVLGSVAEFVTNQIVPGMKAVGEVIYDVGSTIVSVIGSIPAPIGIAAAAIGGLALLGPRLASLGATVASTLAGPFVRFGQQMQVQTALAGMMGTQLGTTGAAVGTFRARLSGAGGALGVLRKGFTGLLSLLGGPWTVAIAGVVAGLTYLFTRQSAAERAAEAHKEAFQGLTDTLVASKGKYTGTVVDEVIKGLEKTSILDNAKHLGVELDSLTNAVTKGGKSYTTYSQELEKVALTSDKFRNLGDLNRQGLATLGAQLAKTGGSAEEFSFIIDSMADSYQNTSGATDEQRAQMHLLITEYLDLAGGTKLAREENRKAADSAGRQTEASKASKTATEGQTGAIKLQVIELSKLIAKEQERAGVILSSREAQRQYQESVDAARASIAENGRTTDINTSKGRANQAALDAMANSALAQAAAMERNGASQETTGRKISRARDQFIRTARQMGLSRTAAEKLADQLRLIPGRYVAEIDATTQKAVNRITKFFDKYDGLRLAINLTPFGVAFQALQAVGGRATGGPGGPVKGPGSGTSDTAGLYALSNNEHVVTDREVRGAGGHAAIYRQRAQWRAGIPGRRNGGPGGPTLDVDLAGVAAAERRINSVGSAFAKIAQLVGTGPVNPGLDGALKWARSQVGKPYIWGGVGPGGYDCSGFMSAITNVIRGKGPHSRLGATASFPWGGFVPGKGAFMIGSTPNAGGGIGHMAGTLNGVNVESAGGVGVKVGSSARGATNGLFGGNVYRIQGFRDGGAVKKMRPGDPPFDLLKGITGRELLKTMGSYRDGTGYVPRTGPYMLHRGERVTPADQNSVGTTVVNNNFNLTGAIISSQRDAEDWLTTAMQRMHDRGRLNFK